MVTPTDVARREQVVAAVETVERELGPISVLINNAGAYLRKRFTEITEEDFDFQLKVNAYGPFFCTQAVIGKMAERKAGTVIFVLGSESRSGPAQYAAYNASKLAQRDRGVGGVRIHAFRSACGGARRRWRGGQRASARIDAGGGSVALRAAGGEIRDEIVHLINQSKSAWTFQVDMRAFVQWRPRVAPKKKPERREQSRLRARRCGLGGSGYIMFDASGCGADW